MLSMRSPIIPAMLSYIAWGVLPLYWKLFQSVPTLEILAHRIFWSAVYLGMLVRMQGRWALLWQALRAPMVARRSLLCALLIGGNWCLYIGSVNTGRIVEASLGYFICPLVVVALGWILRGETLRTAQTGAVALAACGVGYSVYTLGHLPFIALGLAISFALYGYFKKGSALGATEGLLVETLLLAPIAIVFLVYQGMLGEGAFLKNGGRLDLWFILAGVATSLPLQWFAMGAQRLPMATVGVLQYVSPTLQLLIGLWVYHEPVSSAKFVTFGCIWAGLALYSWDALRQLRLAPPREKF